MDPKDHVEMLERALAILAESLAFNDRASFAETAAKIDEIISCAKVRALTSMQILPEIESDHE